MAATAGNGTVQPSLATSGSYWQWVQTTYDGLKQRFGGDMKLVAEQLRVIECLTFQRVFGVAEYSDAFVKNFHLVSKRPACGEAVAAVENGQLAVAVETAPTRFQPEAIRFAAPQVIEEVKREFAEATPAPAPRLNPEYIKEAKAVIDRASQRPTPPTHEAAATGSKTRSAHRAAHKLCH
ncbi:hypothetical protein ATCC90586_006075 [Pythium insidiosum]|nr:hypothetical protein ATCC90586_006075 [Pythium insidiosum]